MITKWNFQTPTEEELHKRDKLASELELSPFSEDFPLLKR